MMTKGDIWEVGSVQASYWWQDGATHTKSEQLTVMRQKEVGVAQIASIDGEEGCANHISTHLGRVTKLVFAMPWMLVIGSVTPRLLPIPATI